MMKRILLIFLSLLVVSCSQEKEIIVDTTDPYIWLEEVEGVDALNWVKEQNEITKSRYAESDSFTNTYNELLEEYQSNDRIPYVYIMGEEMYNFWRDEKNVRGLWRKTSIESYQTDNPEIGRAHV